MNGREGKISLLTKGNKMAIGIFSKFIFNNAIFNTDSGTPPDGGSGVEGGQYRENLEKLIKIHSQRITKIRQVKKIARIAEAVNIPAPVIQKAIEQIKIDINALDFSAIQNEANRLISIITQLIREEEIEQENEILLLMLI